MLILMVKNADGTVNGVRKALFASQSYDVADDEAQALIKAERAVDGSHPAGKAVHGPPEDKAVKRPRVK